MYKEKVYKYDGNGTPEEWVHYQKQMEELFEKMKCSGNSNENVATHHRQYQATLRETTKEEYVQANSLRLLKTLRNPTIVV